MHPSNSKLIVQMTEDLQPVRVLQQRDGLVIALAVLLASLLIIEVFVGLWRAGLTGQASSFFIVTNGILFVLGLASASSAIAMASPRVGNQHSGPHWAMAMLGILPIAAFVTLLGPQGQQAFLADHSGFTCLTKSVLTGALTALALTLWLRRGAPVSHNVAGWHIGVAAGALGSLAYGLSCAIDGVAHLGIWHIAPVPICALAGRLIIPRAIRW